MLPLITLLTSLLDPKANGPLPKRQEDLGQQRQLTAFRWTISDMNHVQRLTVRK